LRADHLSSYGYSRNTSPYIDRIAKEGSLFENAIAPSSWTQPSHASLLTGRYTYEHQAELVPLDDRFQTISEALQEQGYRTGAVSANLFFFTRRQGFGRGFAHFEDNFQTIPDMASNTLYGYIFDYYFLRKILNYEEPIYRKLADDVTESALSWIQIDTQKPYFMFLNYFDVHDPYTPPDPYRAQFSSIDNPGGVINSYVERYSPQLTPEQLQGEIDAYDGSILFVDDEIERLLNGLRQSGQLDNTIVIIASDHGESFGEHGLLQHSNSLYIEQIHVPLIIWWPGKIPANNRVNLPVSISALPATILSFVNGDSGSFPGPALDSLALGQAAPEDFPDPISELEQFTGASDRNPSTHGELKSVVSPDLQYIIHETFGEELYDWKSDPQEMVNLADKSDQQSTMDVFRQYLENLVGADDFWGE
jgi:arylsulfatase A-like enzyme